MDKATPAYSFISTLRLLSYQTQNPFNFELNKLEHHAETRKTFDPASWRFHQRFVVDVLKSRFNEDKIHQNLCRIRTNSLELNSASKVPIVGLFPIYSLLNHACVHNTYTTKGDFQSGFKTVVRASRDIKQGEEVTTRYIPSGSGRIRRQKSLKDVWCFECGCALCRDPTEFGTFFSALRCPCCVDNFVLPVANSRWNCDQCNFEMTEDDVLKIEADLEKLTVNYGEPKAVDEALKCIEDQVHQNHHIAVKIKQKYVNTTVTLDLTALDVEDLKRRLKFAGDVLDVRKRMDFGNAKWMISLNGKIKELETELQRRLQHS